ncbi:MAG: TIGR00159 family protein [Deltaproteobacteria bacterium]|nr:TIGR00159 family protein [Deltaproteobacteria bacterium]
MPIKQFLEIIMRAGNLVALFDILIVASILYWFMRMFKGTRAERMFWGLAVIIMVYFISQRVELLTLHWILSNFLGSIVIFIIVVFQQDIRKALVHVGRPFFISRATTGPREVIEEITRAAAAMSKTRTGGLLVMERAVDIGEFLEAGVEVDANVSKELVLSIFNSGSPLHDGAVVIRGARVYKAGCILPLTGKEPAKAMGTRHRAAMGLAEETDAAIIVISGETGEMTMVVEDGVFTGLDSEKLSVHLKRLFSVAGGFAGEGGR